MKSAKAPAFMFYASDFLSDENVAVMSNEELGCYIKLICYAWREGSIPADPMKIARLCGERPDHMEMLWLQIEPCFRDHPEIPGRLVQPRLEKERERQAANRESRSKTGKMGAEARWNNELGQKFESSNGSGNASPIPSDSLSVSVSGSPCKHIPNGMCDEPSSSTSNAAPGLFPDIEGGAAGTARTRNPSAKTPPPCPQQEIINLYHELLPSNPKTVSWTKAREAKLRSRWREISVSKNSQLGNGYATVQEGVTWWRDFLGYCAKSRFLTGKTEPSPGRRPFVATLEWIISPNNFPKIIEGTYHRD